MLVSDIHAITQRLMDAGHHSSTVLVLAIIEGDVAEAENLLLVVDDMEKTKPKSEPQRIEVAFESENP